MPTMVSLSDTVERRLWTAEEFLEWLKPEVRADLIDGGRQEYWILDPERLAHRFYRREGELLVEFAAKSGRIAAQTLLGFWLNRAWLDPEKVPEVNRCLSEILAAPG